MKEQRILVFILVFYLTLNVNIIKANRTDTFLLTTTNTSIQDNEAATVSQTSSLFIDDDSDFITLNFPGSGTKGDPYLIENYQIITTGREAGIDIQNTSKHFIIRNCNIETDSWGIRLNEIAPNTASIMDNAFIDNDYKAISIYNSIGVTISNNKFKNNSEALYLRKSSFLTISNNTFEENWHGLHTSGTDSFIIENNFFYSNVIAISITAVTGFCIKNNVFTNNSRYGMNLFATDNTLVSNNTCSDSGWQGIIVRQSMFVDLKDNTLTNDGIHIDYYSVEHGRFLNNQVNSRILGFFKNKNDLELKDPIYGQLILLDCKKGTISNQNLSSTSVGITLYNCEKTTIINSTCNNNDGDGIQIHNSDGCSVSNNTCNNNDNGISVVNSNHCNVSNNILLGNWESIELTKSNSAEINLNKCSFNKNHGITIINSKYGFVTNNNCSDNHNDGIRILSSNYFVIANNSCINNREEAIYLLTTTVSIVYNNLCKNNTNGIYIGHSGFSAIPEFVPPPPDSYSEVISNHLEENSKYGVYLNRLTQDNSVHHNSFINNGEEGIAQAYDTGEGNTWFDEKTKEGNFWSNYTGGFYIIAGDANSIDKYPLIEPKIIEMPEISSSWPTYRTKLNPLIICIGIVTSVILHRKKIKKCKNKILKRVVGQARFELATSSTFCL